MKRKSFLKKATNSFVGRVLRRLLGEENGAVMMEYIVIALLIAAAAVVAVGVFGSVASGMFASLTNYMTNQRDIGNSRLKQVRENANSGIGNAQTHVNSNINSDNTGVSEATTWGASDSSSSSGSGGGEG